MSQSYDSLRALKSGYTFDPEMYQKSSGLPCDSRDSLKIN